jgi:hypothetical protein
MFKRVINFFFLLIIKYHAMAQYSVEGGFSLSIAEIIPLTMKFPVYNGQAKTRKSNIPLVISIGND